MSNENSIKKRGVWSWALYDWANSAFATTVMAGFFPIFFKEYWNSGVEAVESTFRLGVANSAGSVVIMLFAPFLGALADQLGARKGFLLLFTGIGLVMTGGLYWVAQGAWWPAAVLYVLAMVGFSGSNLFYDSLLPFVAGRRQLDRVSALGYALGYLGGGLLFFVNVMMVRFPAWFGFADPAEAVRTAFIMVAVWWGLFSLPLFFGVVEPEPGQRPKVIAGCTAAVKQLRDTISTIGQYRQVVLFLVAYWFYIDGVGTVIRMAVDYGLSLGFPSNSLIVALLITQFVGFPAALVFGRLGESKGPRIGIFVGLGIYVLVTAWGALMDEVWEFYVLAIVVGLVQGGVQSLSRSLYARLVPQGRSAEFFGFYNLLGKFAAILGPLLMGWVGVVTGHPRLGILSVLILFLIGGGLLWGVKEGGKA